MRIYIAYPNQTKLDEFLSNQQQATFSYSEIGYTKMETTRTPKTSQKPKAAKTLKTPKGYTLDYYSIAIGEGDQVWQKAKEALQQWQHFPPSFTKIYQNTPDTTKIAEGNVVVVMIYILGLWWRNTAKIVYTFDEPNRFGFAYGTLQDHAEKGEEAFWISKDKDSNITYHIHAISKPKFWAAKLAYPLTRKYQRKFARESIQNMKDICAS